jgi:hypothetical protein
MKISLIVLTLVSLCSFDLSAKTLTYKKVHSMAADILKDGSYDFPSLKINDIETFCPKYADFDNDDKNDFFAHLVTNIASYESDFRTDDAFAENNGNSSVGLMSISYPSLSEAYKDNGCSVIKIPADLTDPEKNLKCGFGIIKTLIVSREYLSNKEVGGVSSYWSSMRTPYDVFIKALNKTVNVGKKDLIISDLKERMKKCFK